MKRTICVLVVSVMLISVLCGCDTLSKTARIIPQNTEQEQTPAVVEYSDTLKIALNHAKSLNPYDEQDKANLQALRLIYTA